MFVGKLKENACFNQVNMPRPTCSNDGKSCYTCKCFLFTHTQSGTYYPPISLDIFSPPVYFLRSRLIIFWFSQLPHKHCLLSILYLFTDPVDKSQVCGNCDSSTNQITWQLQITNYFYTTGVNKIKGFFCWCVSFH